MDIFKTFKNQNGFFDINNDTDRSEVINNLYRVVYPMNMGWEVYFPFEIVKDRNTRFTRKKPIKYKVGIGDNFLTDTKKIIEYSMPEYEEKYIHIDKAFSFGRKYTPLENLTPELIAADLDELSNTEVQLKRKAILDMIQNEGILIDINNSFDITKDALSLHDNIIDYCYEVGINIQNLILFCSMEFLRSIRDTLKLTIGATNQIEDVLNGVGVAPTGMYTNLEGLTYIAIPKKVTTISPTGSIQKIALLGDGVHVCGVEMNSLTRPFKALQWVHTPLRAGKNGVGNGEGNVDIIEEAYGYDVCLIEPLKVFYAKISTQSKPVELSSIITTLNLGEILDKTETTILEAINTKNSLNLTTSDILIASITDTGAKISAKNTTKYSGSLNVVFSLKSVRLQKEAEAKAKQEAEAKAKQEAEAKAKQEAEAKAKQEAEAKAKQEAEAKAKQEAEAKAKQEAEAKDTKKA
ncbi:hypothetical protein [Spiroplasma endosymbiont of Aspidapion aeneum]|uniref:hypothetical protein n=1 Tax=Spiroplasma endosymbiont of Aspidapion aeneum TaxID=3066276 RepID=UPI00313DE3B0